ncbi:MAG: methionine gamma-lyase family protein [Oscillospiraceae bacterium]|nr:methionine gamma-lyase family protein [Oscillospiraceae bacterium]
MVINDRVYDIAQECEERCRDIFSGLERISLMNTQKVLDAFQKEKVSESCFSGTTGYGYDDLGRETLDRVYADVFRAESALVRIGFVNGTHAISTAIMAMLAPGDVLLSVTGSPYDTLRSTIGADDKRHGSLSFYGIGYKQIELNEKGGPDFSNIKKEASNPLVKAVLIQRSRGYSLRKALSVDEIAKICSCVKEVNPETLILVDNCYGEFTEEKEPIEAGADLIAGSLIKNPGGGLAPAGGYIAGKSELVEKAAMCLTTPGIGGECGATLGNNRLLFQGLYFAPHCVCQAMKTAVFCAAIMEQLGMETSPAWNDKRSDIIQAVSLGSKEKMVAFCKGIQSGSAVDSYVSPESWNMPGYDCEVIMAAGNFIQGASLELSADGPVREPYTVYLQGGLTYEAGKLGIMNAVSAVIN